MTKAFGVCTKTGGDFLVKHIKRAEDCRCYFSLTADGRPIKLQRKLFTECFYAIAMSELFKATEQVNYMVKSIKEGGWGMDCGGGHGR